MKAVVLTGIRQMKIKDIPEPIITDNRDVLIKVSRIGVCGSDVHYYASGRIGSQVVNYPFTVGHEMSGIVMETGSAVSKLRPGDRVAIDPALSCWKCDQCLAGRHHTCRELKFLGCPGQAEGALSEYIVMPESSCYPVPENLDMDQAVISEPLAIGLYAILKSEITGDNKIGILGFGPIGMSVFLSARYNNVKDIYITDRVDERLNIAVKSGASYAGNPDKTNIVKEILNKEPLQLDAVFECCGKQEAVDQAIDLLKPGGKLMVIGIPDFNRWSFSVDKTRRKEITIQNIRRQVDCTKLALDLIAEDKINVSQMITHHYRFEDTEKAFELVSNYKDGVMKAIVEFE
ncbi:MAG: alcohol dehydrogenase catalytic domain-containing protein [Bacteroidales bacterium]|nr:MAG: alcohol dehydrogenase catalytic domain-containing protein [Bacteroidales bacterium]